MDRESKLFFFIFYDVGFLMIFSAQLPSEKILKSSKFVLLYILRFSWTHFIIGVMLILSFKLSTQSNEIWWNFAGADWFEVVAQICCSFKLTGIPNSEKKLIAIAKILLFPVASLSSLIPWTILVMRNLYAMPIFVYKLANYVHKTVNLISCLFIFV